jgi:hypothetical protein
MRVGFWLDWNGNVEDELSTNKQMLELFVFDREIEAITIKHWAAMLSFDGDLLTFDYGGISGGYGPNPIVPALVETVQDWCKKNPDRLAMVWCTFPPEHYREDFKYHGGIPNNLRFWHRYTEKVLTEELQKHYPAD